MYPTHRWQAIAKLTVEEEEALQALAVTWMTCKAGDTIRWQGGIVSGFYLLRSGWVASSILLPGGGRLIQKVHLPGDMLGTPSMVLTHAADTLTAVTDASIAFVPFDRLGELYSRMPRLYALFTFVIQVERLALADAMAVKGRATAKQQLAHLLVDLHMRLAPLGLVEADTFEVPLTQEMIGDLLGLTAVHVSRMMSALRKDGLIAQQARKVRILDVPALRALAPIDTRQLRFNPVWLPPAG